MLGLMIFSSCATKASTVEKKETEKTAVESNLLFGLSNDAYSELMKTSLISTGNNYRVKKVIEKLRAGEKVYVACIGGSVTEGAGPANFKDGYAYQFNNKLKKEFTPDNGVNVIFDGAGLSGTPSPLGLIRYESDVVKTLGSTPDILVIEFAVNDGGECTNQRAFEALVRNALIANPNTAVIALYAAATYNNTQIQMKRVADFYEIPQISIMDVYNLAKGKNLFKQTDFFTDTVHPTKDGHSLMADALINLFREVDAQPLSEMFAIPESWYKQKPFANFKRILGDDENVKITKGSFSSVDGNTQSIKKTNKGNFPQNWHHASGEEVFKMEINCKNLLFVYKVQGSWLTQKFGKAEVYVDGVKVATYDGGAAGGWNNCETRLIIDEEVSANHVVEVKMAEGDEKKGFTIVAMGYCAD